MRAIKRELVISGKVPFYRVLISVIADLRSMITFFLVLESIVAKLVGLSIKK